MVRDSRTRKTPDSASEVVESGQSGSAVTLLNLIAEQSFSIQDYVIKYSEAATVNGIKVEFHDADSSTTAGNTTEDDALFVEELDPTDRVSHDGPVLKDVEDDIIVIVDRDGTGVDGDMIVRVGGYHLT